MQRNTKRTQILNKGMFLFGISTINKIVLTEKTLFLIHIILSLNYIQTHCTTIENAFFA